MVSAPVKWVDRGACAGDLLFTDQSISQQLDQCERCPVTTECLEYGLTLPETPDDAARSHVVFGGVSPTERARLRRQLRGGR